MGIDQEENEQDDEDEQDEIFLNDA